MRAIHAFMPRWCVRRGAVHRCGGKRTSRTVLISSLDDNARVWGSIARLNEFLSAARRANVSPIFEWYVPDFERSGAIEKFRRAMRLPRRFSERVVKIEYQTYDWGPNDSQIWVQWIPGCSSCGTISATSFAQEPKRRRALGSAKSFANFSHFRPYRSGPHTIRIRNTSIFRQGKLWA